MHTVGLEKPGKKAFVDNKGIIGGGGGIIGGVRKKGNRLRRKVLQIWSMEWSMEWSVRVCVRAPGGS